MQTKRNLKWLFVLALAMSMILAACSGGSGTKGTGSGPDIDEGKGKGIEGGDLVVAIHSDANSLDPHGSNDVPSSLYKLTIYETLVNRDPKIKYCPRTR